MAESEKQAAEDEMPAPGTSRAEAAKTAFSSSLNIMELIKTKYELVKYRTGWFGTDRDVPNTGTMWTSCRPLHAEPNVPPGRGRPACFGIVWTHLKKFILSEYLPLVDVIKLGKETALLNSAARLHTKWAMIGLRRSISKMLRFLAATLKDLPIQKDHLRNEIVKSFYLTRYVSTEVELFFASVWRFRDDEDAWNILSLHLGPVITEFEKAITAQSNTETNKPDLTPYRVAQLLREWYILTESLETGLYDTLDSAASHKTPYEIRVIDILMCAPSYNFQLGLKRTTELPKYDVYGFFKSPNLKPVAQVPNVFNSQLDVSQKKRLLITYLRETVQRENISFLAEFTDRIHALEMQQMSYFGNNTEDERWQIINRLSEEYENVHETPYSSVLKKFRYRIHNDLYEENYMRCPNENLSFTGLHCIVVAPRQDISNVPLAIPFLRGRRQKLYDLYECETQEGPATCPDLFSRFVDCPSYTDLTSSESKPKLQLLIHYRESYLAGPSEVVVNIGYDHDDQCYMTFENLHGELLHPPSPAAAIPLPTPSPSPPP